MALPTNQHSRGFLLDGEVQTALDALNTAHNSFNATDGGVVSGSVGFFGHAAVGQPTALGGSVSFAAGAGTAVNNDSTFGGGVGSSSYTIGDIVTALKNLGLIAS